MKQSMYSKIRDPASEIKHWTLEYAYCLIVN